MTGNDSKPMKVGLLLTEILKNCTILWNSANSCRTLENPAPYVRRIMQLLKLEEPMEMSPCTLVFSQFHVKPAYMYSVDIFSLDYSYQLLVIKLPPTPRRLEVNAWQGFGEPNLLPLRCTHS